MHHMSAYLTFFHSVLRYVIILAAIIVCVQSLVGMLQKGAFKKSNKTGILLLQIFCDLQLLFGLFLYYTSGFLYTDKKGIDMHNHYSRFYLVEHPVSMIIAIILVHIGYKVAKKNIDDNKKFKRLFWYVFVALVIFMAQTPWQGKLDIGKPNIPQLSV